MRTDATTQQTTMAKDPYAPQRFRLKVEIDRDGSGSTYVDVSDWNGLDFVRSFSRQRSLDKPAISAQLTLAAWLRDPQLNSLSPAMANSNLNTGGLLCKPYNRVKVSVSVEPEGTAHTSYHLLFEGRIDRWAQQAGALTLECRDLICDLQDTTIETEAQYGAEDPSTATANNMEEIIQNILDDHINTTPSALRTNSLSARTTDGVPWQLYSATGDSTTPFNAGDATGAGIRIEQMAKRTIWDAISMFPTGIAYRLSRRWHNGSGINGFVLVLEEPARVAVTPDITLDPTLGQCRVLSSALSREHVRNRVAIGYQKGAGIRDLYFTNDATSETDYGKRYIGIDVGAASQVDTLIEAQKMGNGILTDAKDPENEIAIEAKLMWFLELNDLVRVKADKLHFDSQKDLAVVALQDTIVQGGAAKTIVSLRGKPAAGIKAHTKHQRVFPVESKTIDVNSIGSSILHNPIFSIDLRI